jgi:hypothetical protein
MAEVLREAGGGFGAGGLKSAASRFPRFKSKEVSLNWNISIRQIHRWLSIAFTVAVIVNVIAMMQEKQAVWVGLLALFPLILLLLSGLYLFALPYAAKWRGARGISGQV